MRVVPSCTPSEQGTAGLPRMCTLPVGDVRGPPPWSFTAPHCDCTKVPLVAVFTAQWYIAMRVVPSCTPSEQGTAGLSSKCTQLVGDVPDPSPFNCTGPYSVCTKLPLTAECLTASGELLRESFRVVHLVNKAQRDFPGCIHCLWMTYGSHYHGALQLQTAGVQKFRWRQSFNRPVVHCHEGYSESYT